MRYYRVKPQYDNYKLSRDYEIFVSMLRNAEIFKLQEVLQ